MPAKTPRNCGVFLKQRARGQDLAAVDAILAEAHGARARRKNKAGAPTKFNKEIAYTLLAAMAQGMTVQAACKKAGISVAVLYKWAKMYPTFVEALSRAKQEGAEQMVYAALDEAMQTTDRDSAQAARVRSDVLLKVASKIDPARYGDRPNQNAGVVVNITTNLEPPPMDDEGIYTITVPASSGALAPLTAPPST